jgi:hypothetical protein
MSVKSQFNCALCKKLVAYDPEKLTPDEFEMCSNCMNNVIFEIKNTINERPIIEKDFKQIFNLLLK